MLYQTVPSFHPFQIKLTPPFFSSPLLLQLSLLLTIFFSSLSLYPPFISLSLSQVEKRNRREMECVEAKALKNSFRPAVEMSLKSNQQQQQVVFEDIISGSVPLVGVGVGVGVGGDETFVDDFLDFSNEDVENEQGGLVVVVKDDDDDDEDEEDGSSSHKQDDTHNSSNGVSPKNDVFGSELSVPTDDLADLEWLSHFVEDSFSEFSLQHLPGNPSEKTGTLSTQKPETGTPLSEKPVDFPIPIPARARSKRSRAVRVWSIGGSSSVTENSSYSSTTSTSSSSSSCLIFNNSGNQNLECFEYFEKPPAMKKQKKKKKKQGIMVYGQNLQPIRRCSHCGVQKTPQWRAGPNGAKTLCNACGVRFKSGRLLPEYRPACSPTFSSKVHSNNHRKVLEMRKKKEMGPKESGFAPAVHSF